MKKFSTITILFLLLLCAYFLIKWQTSTPIEHVESTVVLNKIEKVMKLVNVEGNFSELLTYQDYEYFDFPGFRKKAIVKVDAKVLAGFDLNKMEITTDEATKTINIKNMPDPEILAIDHNLSYYDMEQGLFNSFDEKTLTALQDKAKALIQEKVKETNLLQQAKEQQLEVLNLIYYLGKSTGWKIIIEGKPLQNNGVTINKK